MSLRHRMDNASWRLNFWDEGFFFWRDSWRYGFSFFFLFLNSFSWTDLLLYDATSIAVTAQNEVGDIAFNWSTEYEGLVTTRTADRQFGFLLPPPLQMPHA